MTLTTGSSGGFGGGAPNFPISAGLEADGLSAAANMQILLQTNNDLMIAIHKTLLETTQETNRKIESLRDDVRDIKLNLQKNDNTLEEEATNWRAHTELLLKEQGERHNQDISRLMDMLMKLVISDAQTTKQSNSAAPVPIPASILKAATVTAPTVATIAPYRCIQQGHISRECPDQQGGGGGGGRSDGVGELKKEMDGLKVEMNKMKEEFAAKLQGQIAEKNGEMGKMKAEIQGLAEENWKMKEEMDKMKAAKDEEKTELEGLKAEIDNKMNGKSARLEGKMRELQEKKADKEMLANLINVQMELVKFKNKWNAGDSGPKLVISEGGLVVKHSSNDDNAIENCIRAISPIPSFILNAEKPTIAGYFEVEILAKNRGISFDIITIGFCPQQFPLEAKRLGRVANTIGIAHKEGMHINGEFNKFGNRFEPFFVGDVLGLGIIHFPRKMQCFATCNGQLLGTFDVPFFFTKFELFPAATLFSNPDSIRANFGLQKWRFNPGQLLQ